MIKQLTRVPRKGLIAPCYPTVTLAIIRMISSLVCVAFAQAISAGTISQRGARD